MERLLVFAKAGIGSIRPLLRLAPNPFDVAFQHDAYVVSQQAAEQIRIIAGNRRTLAAGSHEPAIDLSGLA
jgi:hypothetical protein